MLTASLITAALVVAAGSSGPSDRGKRRIAHQVDQALLYVDMRLPERAREQLKALVASPPGESDALAWLALARAYYAERRLDEAGQAVRRAQGLGVADRLGEKNWALKFFRRFQNNVGGLRIWDDACTKFTFSAKLAVPIVDRQRRALLNAVPGWRTKTFVRDANRVFFLPKGDYQLGKARVQIIPGEDTSAAGQDLGATCNAARPKVAALTAKASESIDEGGTAATTSAPREESSSIFSNPWLWVIVGAAAVAGGTTAAVLATQQGSDDPDRFRLVF